METVLGSEDWWPFEGEAKPGTRSKQHSLTSPKLKSLINCELTIAVKLIVTVTRTYSFRAT